ncbi:TraB/GumN family protein [Brevundimonas sp. SL130]|uniref:TraB/GumN family protein n=1 Tax=Brevundimonas sp. SL130 TaxID=2995143 RepID=UPI00226C9947|nr:TraB/GumN family protein [Brevundimonas sp. SL130]WAC59820.1 TraB/GumN family protein [Brevundimonas sp. SL130]
MKALILALGLIAAATPTLAQTAEEPATVDEIIVVARRIEGPMWEVQRGDSTLILVGSINGLPRDMEWRTDALVSAVEGADRVLFPIQGQASLADVGRLLWRMRTLTRLPDGRTSADYLSPDLEARVERITAEGPSRQSMMMLSADLMEHGGYARRARPVSEVVRRAARASRKPAEPVGVFHGDEMVEKILTTPPEAYLDCIEKAATAAEAGEAEGERRAEAWRRRQVPAVLASPLEQATNACSYWAVMGEGERLRGIWNKAVDEALSQPGVTVAIAPLRLLAETDGVLDRLETQGLEPIGPEWRPVAP